MLDLNDAIDQDQLFQAFGVEDSIALFIHYPMFCAPAEDEVVTLPNDAPRLRSREMVMRGDLGGSSRE